MILSAPAYFIAMHLAPTLPLHARLLGPSSLAPPWLHPAYKPSPLLLQGFKASQGHKANHFLLRSDRFLPHKDRSQPHRQATRPVQEQEEIEGMAANVGGKSVGGGAGAGGTVGGGGGGVTACRPSGSRWTPTPEQIRILKELYYGCGIRSPTSEQIQRITAMLRQHGKIEGKNVFYWFQNHKARERQKRRLTNLDVNVPAAAADATHLGVLSLSSPSSGAPPPSSPLVLYAGGNGGGAATHQLDASSDWGSTAMASETCFLQDYMGVRSTTGGHHGSSTGTSAAASPWASFSSSDSSWAAAPAPTTTRAPETLPLFPTGDSSRPPRSRHGAPAGDADAIRGGGGGGGSYYLPNLPVWGAAATTSTATATTTSVTIQQQHQLLLQRQEQYNFYTTTQQLQPSHDASTAAAAASLELSLSSWCSPYPAGTM